MQRKSDNTRRGIKARAPIIPCACTASSQIRACRFAALQLTGFRSTFRETSAENTLSGKHVPQPFAQRRACARHRRAQFIADQCLCGERGLHRSGIGLRSQRPDQRHERVKDRTAFVEAPSLQRAIQRHESLGPHVRRRRNRAAAARANRIEQIDVVAGKHLQAAIQNQRERGVERPGAAHTPANFANRAQTSPNPARALMPRTSSQKYLTSVTAKLIYAPRTSIPTDR